MQTKEIAGARQNEAIGRQTLPGKQRAQGKGKVYSQIYLQKILSISMSNNNTYRSAA